MRKIIILKVIMSMMFGVLVLIACKELSIDEYKLSILTRLHEYEDVKGQDNYSAKGWEVILQVTADGKKAIKAVFNDAKDAIYEAFWGIMGNNLFSLGKTINMIIY